MGSGSNWNDLMSEVEDHRDWRKNLKSYLDRRIEEAKYLISGLEMEEWEIEYSRLSTLLAVRETFFGAEDTEQERVVIGEKVKNNTPSLEIAQADVREFMQKAGQDTPVKAVLPSPEICELRVKLIEEELEEMRTAIQDGDLTGYADAICDLLYVVLGAGIAAGLELEPLWQEVQRSNLSKFIDGYRSDGSDGKPVGKWIKGPSYTPANLEPIVAGQM